MLALLTYKGGKLTQIIEMKRRTMRQIWAPRGTPDGEEQLVVG